MNQSEQILLELDARFVFRLDASPAIGVGHAMRSAALAEPLADLGFKTLFVGKTSQMLWLENRLDAIAGAIRVPSEGDFNIRAERDVLIIDSYFLDPESHFLNNRDWLSKAAFMDRSTPNYKVDTYIHPGPSLGWQPPINSKESTVLTGIQYIPLRKSISDLKKRERNSGLKVITVVAGGTDPTNFVVDFIHMLSSIEMQFEVRVFTSRMEIGIPDSRFELYSPLQNLEESLAVSDLVFTTGGTTAWEICSLGIPMGIALAVENQRQNYDFFTENNLAIGIGIYSKSRQEWDIDLESIRTLLTSEILNKKIVDNQLLLPIHEGSKRIASDLIESIVQKLEGKKTTIAKTK